MEPNPVFFSNKSQPLIYYIPWLQLCLVESLSFVQHANTKTKSKSSSETRKALKEFRLMHATNKRNTSKQSRATSWVFEHRQTQQTATNCVKWSNKICLTYHMSSHVNLTSMFTSSCRAKTSKWATLLLYGSVPLPWSPEGIGFLGCLLGIWYLQTLPRLQEAGVAPKRTWFLTRFQPSLECKFLCGSEVFGSSPVPSEPGQCHRGMENHAAWRSCFCKWLRGHP